MSTDELFESWKRRRAHADVPPGFADAVMARLPSPRRRLVACLRVAACLAAGVACLVRIVTVLGLFVPS